MNIPYEKEKELFIDYKGEPLPVKYRSDFVCFGTKIVELKALKKLSGIDESQLINYLKATGTEVGLLINFGAISLEYKRLIFSNQNLRESA